MFKSERAEQIVEILNTAKKMGVEYDSKLADELYIGCQEILKKLIGIRGYNFSAAWGSDDYMHDVILEMWKRLNTFDRSRAGFTTWLGVIAGSVYQKKHEKFVTKTAKQCSMDVPTDEGDTINIIDLYKAAPAIEESYILNEAWNQLLKEIDKLQDNYRRAIILCGVNGMKPAQAAKLLGCTASDVYNWLYRARTKLMEFEKHERVTDTIRQLQVA